MSRSQRSSDVRLGVQLTRAIGLVSSPGFRDAVSPGRGRTLLSSANSPGGWVCGRGSPGLQPGLAHSQGAVSGLRAKPKRRAYGAVLLTRVWRHHGEKHHRGKGAVFVWVWAGAAFGFGLLWGDAPPTIWLLLLDLGCFGSRPKKAALISRRWCLAAKSEISRGDVSSTEQHHRVEGT